MHGGDGRDLRCGARLGARCGPRRAARRPTARLGSLLCRRGHHGFRAAPAPAWASACTLARPSSSGMTATWGSTAPPAGLHSRSRCRCAESPRLGLSAVENVLVRGAYEVRIRRARAIAPWNGGQSPACFCGGQIEGQASVLARLSGAGAAVEMVRGASEALQGRNAEQLRWVEAQAAAVYWGAWALSLPDRPQGRGEDPAAVGDLRLAELAARRTRRVVPPTLPTRCSITSMRSANSRHDRLPRARLDPGMGVLVSPISGTGIRSPAT